MSTEHLPAPRPPAEEFGTVSSVEVTVTLRTTVHLVSCPAVGLADAAERVAVDEIEQFCADFGWEQVSLATAPVIAMVGD